ncbi:MAG: hypothetical protein LJE70_10990 [Chromatiaceae bacterium]|jgi:hypothetical protein|nr:hypothetical protein [Chromatiaceae bacterium]
MTLDDFILRENTLLVAIPKELDGKPTLLEVSDEVFPDFFTDWVINPELQKPLRAALTAKLQKQERKRAALIRRLLDGVEAGDKSAEYALSLKRDRNPEEQRVPLAELPMLRKPLSAVCSHCGREFWSLFYFGGGHVCSQACARATRKNDVRQKNKNRSGHPTD